MDPEHEKWIAVEELIIESTAYLNIHSSFRLLFSCSDVSSCLPLHRLQDARLPCPSPSPGVCSHSCPSSRGCRPTASNQGDEVRISTPQISGQPTICFCPKRFPVQSQGPVRGGGHLTRAPHRPSSGASVARTLRKCV